MVSAEVPIQDAEADHSEAQEYEQVVEAPVGPRVLAQPDAHIVSQQFDQKVAGRHAFDELEYSDVEPHISCRLFQARPEAFVAVLRFAFDELHLHRVQAAIVPRNAASRRVAEKLKLRDEGTAQRYLEINGVWEDHIRFAITSEVWGERGEELIGEWIGF